MEKHIPDRSEDEWRHGICPSSHQAHIVPQLKMGGSTN